MQIRTKIVDAQIAENREPTENLVLQSTPKIMSANVAENRERKCPQKSWTQITSKIVDANASEIVDANPHGNRGQGGDWKSSSNALQSTSKAFRHGENETRWQGFEVLICLCMGCFVPR